MDSNLVGLTYLLHLDRPMGGRCQHYVGWTVDLEQRISSHRTGARERCVFTHEARERGIGFVIARVWTDVTIHHEKQIKAAKNHKRFCPLCNGGPNDHLYNGDQWLR